MKYNLENLYEEELTLILDALSELPLKTTYGLFNKIQQQINNQKLKEQIK